MNQKALRNKFPFCSTARKPHEKEIVADVGFIRAGNKAPLLFARK